MKKSTIFYNGEIITMENTHPEAVFVEDGKIISIGSNKEIFKLKNTNTKEENLEGKVLLPGFIDAHSHITAFAQTLGLVDLSKCTNIKQIILKLQEYKNENKLIDGKWIVGFGYDNNLLEEKRHPSNIELDEATKKNPILISHVSGHMGVTNTIGLKAMNINEETKNPEGGSYGRNKTTGKLNGYMEESAFITNAKIANELSNEEHVELIERAQRIYLKNGITTIQDGLTKEKEFDILRQSSKEYKLKVDTICYIDMSERKRILEKGIRFLRKYVNKLKIGGYKIILDGSPQGKTAWMSKPYIGENEYRGYPAKTDEEILESIEICLNENMQLLAHCNGDEAAEQFIRCIEKFDKEDIKKIRPVMIHAQTIREDQLDKIKKLNIIPSFFVSHTYYWGDVHIKNLGWERAKNISPAKSAEDLAINYTFHQDTPVLSPNILESIWCSVNRATKEGIIIGEEQKIDVYSALKAVTINAAYQYKEEKVKGSIKEGKIANLIILDKNPLKINREEIKNIKVIKTFINGEEV